MSRLEWVPASAGNVGEGSRVRFRARSAEGWLAWHGTVKEVSAEPGAAVWLVVLWDVDGASVREPAKGLETMVRVESGSAGR